MPNWTKPQSDAIFAQGGSLLVSAAAGSGKTAVLVERAVNLLCDSRNPVPADRLLVVTFSNAAAAEMKQRMNLRLSAMIAQDPANIHLQRQQALLQSAQISTIHSFCLELIRQNFQFLDISPDFILADPMEMDLMEQDCVRDCIEEFYARDEDGEFAGLVELLSAGRDDARLVETVLKIYRFSRSHPFYEDWLDGKRAMYDGDIPVSETVWGQSILKHGVDSLVYCRRIMERALQLIEGDEALEKGYLAPFQSDLQQIGRCLSAAEAGDWDATVRELSAYNPQRLGGVRGGGEVKEQAKAARDRSKKILMELGERYLNASAEEFRLDIIDLRPKIGLLFDFVKTFGRRLWERKGEKKRLDFSDLEHLALQLLVTKEDNGQFRRTAKAEEIAARYEMVMVDEYQDTNEVQDMIFTSVSNLQRNLFMVGDVKQSIYSFRQAMPEIFLRKKQVFFPYDTGQFPAKIILDTNFRSRSQVTEGVNFLFSMLMSREIGEMEYTREESLKCGAQYPEYTGAQPEFLLLENPAEAEEDPVMLEAAAVAQKIEELLDEGYQVADGVGMRPARPGDFAILLRSHKRRSDLYVQALTDRGIPAGAETAGGYLDTREISMVLSLCKALDNPLLDVELAAAMLSPLFDFTDDDLARIRLTRRGISLYAGVKEAAARGDSKSLAFLDVFNRLRAMSAILPADRLLLRLYDLTGAIHVAQGMRIGDTRVSNLHLLVEYASSYHKLGYKRLGGFVGFLTRLEERGGDLAPAGNAGAAHSVQVMSIHRSKGLEYPVVFLCDTFHQFNKVDLHAGTQPHSRYGFACMRRDEDSLKQYPTIPMQAIRLESERSMLSEELRILYVALTRAREKLIVTGLCKSNLPRRLGRLAGALQGGKLSPYAVGEAACYADWLLMALLHHESAAPLREVAGFEPEELVNDGNPWKVTVAFPPTETAAKEESAEPCRTASVDPKLLARLERNAAYRYPYENQVRIPTKLGVSTVAKQARDLSWRFSARPKFMSGAGLTGAERGNALHKFMQFSDYKNARENLEEEIIRMESKGFLTKQEVSSLSLPSLRAFFSGDLAGRIFASRKVLRELKFTAECGQDILGDYILGMDEECGVVLQGVADCVFFEEKGAVILDYKTDRASSPGELAARYQDQLRLYRQILAPSLGAPVFQCLLYSFSLGIAIEVV